MPCPTMRTRGEDVGATLRELGKAMLRLKRVTFDYHTMGRDATAARTVEPFGLFFQSGHWYLAGRDVEKDAVRNFRVGRISDLRPNAKAPQSADFTIPRAFRLSSHARSRKAWELGDGDALAAHDAVRVGACEDHRLDTALAQVLQLRCGI